jgi:hypothetical protein
MEGISTMNTLTATFATEASKTATTEDVLGASLTLIGADTRQGMSAPVRQAFATVASVSDGNARREGYLKRYAAAAGNAAPTATVTAAGFGM